MQKQLGYTKGYFRHTRLRNFLLWVVQIAVVVVLAFVVAYFFCRQVKIRDSSMEPTLAADEVYLIDSASYNISSPKRGDIIVFSSPEDERSGSHIKRIIGLPGETIQIVNGQILIDGVTYVENGEYPSIVNPGLAQNKIQLDDDEYFVLGDNRNNSDDSRYADVGPVSRDEIAGKLWFRIRPFGSFGPME